MRKQFTTKEITNRLKKLGFDEPCLAILNSNKILFYGEFKSTHAYYKSGLILWQQAIDFLRVKYDLVISSNRDGGYWIVDVIDISAEDESSPFNNSVKRAMESDFHKALADAIKQALTLIKK